MNNRQIAGRAAKKHGHLFEDEVQNKLTLLTGREFIVEGSHDTKVDVRSTDGELRFSVKKAPTDLQVGLITQRNFINALGITDPHVNQFISEFFGGDDFSHFPRHRKKISDIDPVIADKFLSFLHSSIEDIFKVAVTHGSLNQHDDVNYILFPTVRHNVNTLKMIDVSSLNAEIKQHGKWNFTETGIHLRINDVKVMAVQMFGSGKKYSSGYHSLQFRIACGKVADSHLSNINT